MSERGYGSGMGKGFWWSGLGGGSPRGWSSRKWWWMGVGRWSGGPRRWISAAEEEKKEKVRVERRTSGGGGSGFGMISGRKVAGMWAAVLIVVLSMVMIVNNASLIAQHVRERVGERGEMGFGVQRVWSGGRVRAVPDLGAGRGEEMRAMMVVEGTRRVVLRPHPCEEFKVPPPPVDPKRTGPRPCPVCYLAEETAISQMPVEQRFVSPVLKYLSYVSDPEAAKRPSEDSPGSPFGGYPSLEDRAASFNVREAMTVHCGFVKGPTPGVGTGYDIDEADRKAMYACKGVVVASAIFGNYDQLQQPKNISDQAKEKVCFFMFVDEETEASLGEYESFQSTKRVGLWRIVVVHNLPYKDARRNGKIPKLLLHRLFPNVRFSIWVDGKLELVQDPYKILERFLWRSNDTFAISQHYKRFDVFLEAEANKAAAKYDNRSIDAQVDFYRQEGLTPYSVTKYPITSDVPEGCVIIREHTPIANLMSCTWFNEVDRFTSRDQLSFGIVRDKLTANLSWHVNMFKDCERRNFVVQAYHRDLLEKRGALSKSNPSKTAEVREDRSDPGDSVVFVKPVVIKQVPSKRVFRSSKHRKEVQGRHPGLRKLASLP